MHKQLKPINMLHKYTYDLQEYKNGFLAKRKK